MLNQVQHDDMQQIQDGMVWQVWHGVGKPSSAWQWAANLGWQQENSSMTAINDKSSMT